jgi:hypothetical protein
LEHIGTKEKSQKEPFIRLIEVIKSFLAPSLSNNNPVLITNELQNRIKQVCTKLFHVNLTSNFQEIEDNLTAMHL